MAKLSDDKPLQDGERLKARSAVPFWFGALVTLAVLLFLMFVVVAGPIPCENRQAVVFVFALGSAVAAFLMGGSISAEWRFVQGLESPIVRAGGGVALFLVVLWIGRPYASSPCQDLLRSVKLFGRVVSASSGRPIGGASITVEGWNFAATSEADGAFLGLLGDAPRGELLRVRVTHPCFHSERKTISVGTSNAEIGEVRLSDAF